jgi:sec-independent protein translocase protein TatB
MFDFGAWELALIAAVVIFVIGPKELPATLRALGLAMRKLHNLSVIFRAHVDDMVREAELDELRKTASDMRNGNYGKIVEDTVDPDNEIRDAFDDVRDFDIPAPDPHSAEDIMLPKDADKPLNVPRDEP